MLKQIARFGLAGLANTAVGYAVIMALDVGLHLPSALANACGYVVGISVAFLLNRNFVFRGMESQGVIPRYLVTVGVAFAFNQGVLAAGRALLGTAPMMRGIEQLIAMGSYTVLSFLICRYWVFASRPAASA